MRTPDGDLKTYDDPKAGTSSGQGTFTCNINDAGTISGGTIEGTNVIHAFLLTPDGDFTTFEAPGAGTGA